MTTLLLALRQVRELKVFGEPKGSLRYRVAVQRVQRFGNVAYSEAEAAVDLILSASAKELQDAFGAPGNW
jgi:hypothetical protein